MDKKRLVLTVGVVAATILAVQSITASNMGFKLNKALSQAGAGTPVSLTGRYFVALPDNRQTGLNNAKNLIDDLGLAQTNRVERFKTDTDTYEFYSGRSLQSGQVNFALTAGEGFRVRMNTTVNYIIVGSDDPAIAYTLNAAGSGSPVSLSGRNIFAYNYHQTSANAKQLIDEIGLANVNRLERYKTDTDTFEFYSGRSLQSGQVNFALTPGEAIRIRMNTTTAYTPSHY